MNRCPQFIRVHQTDPLNGKDDYVTFPKVICFLIQGPAFPFPFPAINTMYRMCLKAILYHQELFKLICNFFAKFSVYFSNKDNRYLLGLQGIQGLLSPWQKNFSLSEHTFL